MGLNGDVPWPPLFSVSCFLRCCLMHLMTWIMELTFVTALTDLSSTLEGFRQRLISTTSFCSPKTVHWTLLPKPTCKTLLTSSQWPLTILAKPSAQKKTEVMHQSAPGKPYFEPNITINRQQLKGVEKFTYIGSTLSKSIVMDDEVNTWFAKASAAFGRLNRNVWNRRGISEATKVKVYRAIILTTLLYGCETWTTYQRYIKKLNHFHMTCLRKILGITLQKHITDTKVLTLASLLGIYTLMKSQLHWAGYVVCMKDHRLPKKLLYGELSQIKRSQGGQEKRFKDTVKVSMKSFDIAPNCLEYLAQDKDKWREVVKRGRKVCETRRNTATELHMKLRKGTTRSAISASIPCSHYPRLFHA